MSNFRDFLMEEQEDPEIRAEYEALDSEFQSKKGSLDIPNDITLVAMKEAKALAERGNFFDNVEEMLRNLKS